MIYVEPNAEFKAIRPKVMSVILTTTAEIATWLTAPSEEALALQRPLPNGRSGSLCGEK